VSAYLPETHRHGFRVERQSASEKVGSLGVSEIAGEALTDSRERNDRVVGAQN
jgi:hypothetical protein